MASRVLLNVRYEGVLSGRRSLMMRECEELVAALPTTERGWRSLLSASQRLLDYGSEHSEKLPRDKVTATAARCALAGQMLCLLTVVTTQLDQISSRELLAKLGVAVDHLKSQKANIEDKIKNLETLGEKLSEFQFIRGSARDYDGVIADFDRLVVSITADVSQCSTAIDNTKSVVDAIYNKVREDLERGNTPIFLLFEIFRSISSTVFSININPLITASLEREYKKGREEMMSMKVELEQLKVELESLEHRMDDFSIRVRKHMEHLRSNGINV